MVSHHEVVHEFSIRVYVDVEAQLNLVSQEVAVLQRLDQPRQRRQSVVRDHVEADLRTKEQKTKQANSTRSGYGRNKDHVSTGWGRGLAFIRLGATRRL